MRVSVILLAAGASTRMGGEDKLLRRIKGAPLLRHSAGAALDSRAGEVVVVLPPGAPARAGTLRDLPLRCVEAADAGAGMAHSLRAGIAALAPEQEAALVALADLPGLTGAHYDAVIAAAETGPRGTVWRATDETGRAGHPVLLPRALFAGIARLTGDAGARALAQDAETRLVATPGFGATRDLDTPEDWIEWDGGTR